MRGVRFDYVILYAFFIQLSKKFYKNVGISLKTIFVYLVITIFKKYIFFARIWIKFKSNINPILGIRI